MFRSIDYPPIPGVWAIRAQDALDALGALVTADEVTATFGSARTLTEAVLGTPTTGGAATKRAIRATGRLITGRFGPALATEALSWAAAVTGWLSPSSIETFLEHCADTDAVFAPITVSDRDLFVAHLDGLLPGTIEKIRLRALTWWWDWTRLQLDDDRTSDSCDPARWLETHSMLATYRLHMAPAGTADRPSGARTNLIEVLRPLLAASTSIFDLAEDLLAPYLRFHTAEILANPACPQELRDLIRHPYDEATLTLAVLAGADWYDTARVRRMLTELDDDATATLRTETGLRYVAARRDCNLITDVDLIDGDLADVDLTTPEGFNAVFGWLDYRTVRHPAMTADLFIHHPAHDRLIRVFESYSHETRFADPAFRRRLLAEGSDEVAETVFRCCDTTDLVADDLPIARRLGGEWIARCPGTPGNDRPVRPIPLTADWRNSWPSLRDPLDGLDLWERLDSRRGRFDSTTGVDRTDDGRPYKYPTRIRDLERPFTEAPGWAVSLPVDPAALGRNARAMRNCTAGYHHDIRDGSTFIVIVEAPDGERYNVSVRHRGHDRWRVGQINGWANNGVEPAWIRAAFGRRLNRPERRIPRPPAEPRRHHHPRRDRRRERAMMARRRR